MWLWNSSWIGFICRQQAFHHGSRHKSIATGLLPWLLGPDYMVRSQTPFTKGTQYDRRQILITANDPRYYWAWHIYCCATYKLQFINLKNMSWVGVQHWLLEVWGVRTECQQTVAHRTSVWLSLNCVVFCVTTSNSNNSSTSTVDRWPAWADIIHLLFIINPLFIFPLQLGANSCCFSRFMASQHVTRCPTNSSCAKWFYSDLIHIVSTY